MTSRDTSELAQLGHEITKVSFTFYTTEEIRGLSVKSIVNPILLDPLGHPTKGGLYDPALGPMDTKSLCATCSLPYHSCPGHVGHIELAMPVYNPVLFENLYRIIRAKCFFCHHFRMAAHRQYVYEKVLQLLDAGLLVEALGLKAKVESRDDKEERKNRLKKLQQAKGKLPKATLMDTEAKEGEEEEDEEEVENEDEFAEEEAEELGAEDLVKDEESYMRKIDEYVREAMANLKAGKASEPESYTHTYDCRRRTIAEFFRKIPPSVCERCKGISPTIRKDGTLKIFQLPYSTKVANMLKAKNMSLTDVFGNSSKQGDDEMVIDESSTPKDSKQRLLLPIEIRKHFQLLWAKDTATLDAMFGSLVAGKSGAKGQRVSNYNFFFYEVLPIPPTKFRPASKMMDQIYENPQNANLTSILNANIRILELRQKKTANSEMEDPNLFEKVIKHWIELQGHVNNMIDNSKSPLVKGKLPPNGIKQTLERKEGLFRKHMMGKRVNFAARSVISPDPFIETSEIGVPMVFATRLTYPEPVTPYNVKELRQAVINGPDKHPGATHIQQEDGSLATLSRFSLEGRIALSNQLLTPQSGGDGPNVNKKVLRHVRNGDILIMNRQPTLHKPSMMCHVARILPGEKTLRMHYANCNTYNADFDGDEMNLHFPQNEIARAEAYLIANNNNQYLVPTSGSPLRGLIQDHVGAGVILTKRDTFLSRQDYHQLLYCCLPDTMNIETLPPCMIKPKPLWSGKQVVSTILKNLTRGHSPLSLRSKAKIPQKAWLGKGCEESAVIFEEGDLVCGVLDKSQFGASEYGLVHACYELYGADIAGKLLTVLGKLFTGYMQHIGFTCRMDDLLLTPKGDKERKKHLERARDAGFEASCKFLGINNDVEPAEFKSMIQKVVRDDKELAKLENAVKTETNKVTSAVLDTCLPGGLKRKFPDNNMSLMTQSGAKGSNVNMSQICCLLGQQELEGRRVPVMISGKTLPSFQAYDTSARAGGYITQRFLTGIRPQEFFFHCMAGREGLVDTAVKTSRAGYLQRCIIKHLEGLKVSYDQTVRDFDGSVVQFRYGEDALDVMKRSYLEKFDFAVRNYKALLQRHNPRAAVTAVDNEKALKLLKKAKKKPDMDPILSQLNPSCYMGAISERFNKKLETYIENNPDGLLAKDEDDDEKGGAKRLEERKFRALMYLKYLHSLVEPGESVGVLAGQSIGEPSTQMTLNTFHFAGVGAKNVTLGIPRLREIIMTASSQIKTPYMELPLRPEVTEAEAHRLCQTISRLTLSALIDKVSIRQSLGQDPEEFTRTRVYRVNLSFLPKSDLVKKYRITQEFLAEVLEHQFLKRLLRLIAQKLKISKVEIDEIGIGISISKFNEAQRANATSEDGEEALQQNDSDAEDGDADSSKRSRQKKQAASYEDEDEGEGEGKKTPKQRKAAKVEAGKEEEAEEQAKDAGEDADKDEESSDENQEEEDEEIEEEVEIEEKQEEKKKKQPQKKAAFIDKRVSDFNFDFDSNTCQFTLRYPVNLTKLLMISEIEKAATITVLREIKGISKCFIEKNEDPNDKSLKLATEGVNITGIWEFRDQIDINRVTSNNIKSILDIYGVEAARLTIVTEIEKVFAVYGISVDLRHLLLIADYMTFEGKYKAFSRMGMESSSSPLQKMSFETTMSFLRQACLTGDSDQFKSPSSRLVVGLPTLGGTGSFEILQPLK